jgi:hypothetical protein
VEDWQVALDEIPHEVPTITTQAQQEMESNIKQWKHKSHEAIQWITCEVKSSTNMWQYIEKTIYDYLFHSFSPNNKLFSQTQVSKYLESYIDFNMKDIIALSNINESSI